MKISKTHQRLSNRLKNPRVLDHPEEFLGPNWKAVLNFWIYVDTLTEEQWEVIEKLIEDMSGDEWCATFDIVEEVAMKTTSYCEDPYWTYYATLEIIGSHKLLEQQKSFTFIPLFLNL